MLSLCFNRFVDPFGGIWGGDGHTDQLFANYLSYTLLSCTKLVTSRPFRPSPLAHLLDADLLGSLRRGRAEEAAGLTRQDNCLTSTHTAFEFLVGPLARFARSLRRPAFSSWLPISCTSGGPANLFSITAKTAITVLMQLQPLLFSYFIRGKWKGGGLALQ